MTEIESIYEFHVRFTNAYWGRNSKLSTDKAVYEEEAVRDYTLKTLLKKTLRTVDLM